MNDSLIKGYRVVAVPPKTVGRPKPISRIFTVKSAAERFLELARKAGHESATLETVYGVDNARF